MLYYLPQSVQTVTLKDKVIFYHDDKYVEFKGSSLPLIKKALPHLRDGVEQSKLSKLTPLSVDQARELTQALENRGLITTLENQNEIQIDESADYYHLEARTDPEFAQEAISHLESRPSIAVPSNLTDLIDVEYNWSVIPHEDLLVEEVDAFLVSISYHNSPQRNRRYLQAAIENDFYFLPVRLFRSQFILGPLLIPGETTGFESAYRREKANDSDPTSKLNLDQKFEGKVSFPLTEEMRSLVSGAVVTEMKKILTKYYQPNTVDATITVDFETLNTVSNSVLRIPGGEQQQ